MIDLLVLLEVKLGPCSHQLSGPLFASKRLVLLLHSHLFLMSVIILDRVMGGPTFLQPPPIRAQVMAMLWLPVPACL